MKKHASDPGLLSNLSGNKVSRRLMMVGAAGAIFAGNALPLFSTNVLAASSPRGSSGGVTTWASNRLDIFGIGTDNAMYHKSWNGSQWSSSWEALGSVFNSSPSAVAWSTNRLDIFALGTDNAMYHKAWTGSQWSSGWEALGGVFNLF